MPMPLNHLLPHAGSDVLIRELTLDSRRFVAATCSWRCRGCSMTGAITYRMPLPAAPLRSLTNPKGWIRR